MRPTPHSFEDHRWMQHALTLAMRMRGHVWPNPPVGCVIVKNGRVIAEGATRPGGRPHAERVALERAGADARGATLYVTLEPCCHWGKTPPCADAIVEAGIARVVCAIRDPDPRVNGGGFRVLRNADVDLTIGLCKEEAEKVMSGFFSRLRQGEPELVVTDSPAQTVPFGIDARIETFNGRPRLIARSDGTIGEINLPQMSEDRLLVHLGAFGVTSVAVSCDDPLLSRLAPSPCATPLFRDPCHASDHVEIGRDV